MAAPSPTESDPEFAEPPPIIYQTRPFPPHPPITIEERIAVLTRSLDPDDSLYLPSQAKNILAIIELYKKGTITVNDEVFAVDGRIASREECIAAKKPYFWERGNLTGNQLVQKVSYGHGPYANGHELKARIRLPLSEGGDGALMQTRMLNDTDSDQLTVVEPDTLLLASTCPSYAPVQWLSSFVVANGAREDLLCYNMEMQMEAEKGDPWDPWFLEPAVQRLQVPGMSRLSGANMRRQFFMGTSPQHNIPSVATTKGGMASFL